MHNKGDISEKQLGYCLVPPSKTIYRNFNFFALINLANQWLQKSFVSQGAPMHIDIILVTHFSYPFSNSHFLLKNQFVVTYAIITCRVGVALRCILKKLLAIFVKFNKFTLKNIVYFSFSMINKLLLVMLALGYICKSELRIIITMFQYPIF